MNSLCCQTDRYFIRFIKILVVALTLRKVMSHFAQDRQWQREVFLCILIFDADTKMYSNKFSTLIWRQANSSQFIVELRVKLSDLPG